MRQYPNKYVINIHFKALSRSTTDLPTLVPSGSDPPLSTKVIESGGLEQVGFLGWVAFWVRWTAFSSHMF